MVDLGKLSNTPGARVPTPPLAEQELANLNAAGATPKEEVKRDALGNEEEGIGVQIFVSAKKLKNLDFLTVSDP